MNRGSLLHNGVHMVVGRIVLSAARMAAALAVARLAGVESFGAYALLLSYIGLFEWLVDFGQTDIVVRDVAHAPGRRAAMLGALAAAKRIQGVAGGMALPLLLLVTRQGAEMVLAGCAGGIAVLATAWLQPARAALRLSMRMDRDVMAELAGVAVMLPLLAGAALMRAPLPVLVATYSVARLLQAGLTCHWASPRPGGRPHRGAAWQLVRNALPLGLAGLLVVLYDALAPILLARLVDLRAVAVYAAAARFIFPVLVAVQAINAAFFPVIAQGWRAGPLAMARHQQGALVLSVAVAGLLFAGIHGGADFLMGLMGPDFLPGAALLRLMAWVLLARAVSTCMAPLIVIAGRQGRAMLLTLCSLGAQVAALFLLVPRLGVIGAGVGYLLVELLLGSIAVSWVAQQVSGVALDWRPVALLLAIAAGSALSIDATPLAGSLAGGLAAGSLALGAMLLLILCARGRAASLWQDLRQHRTLGGEAA
ncbi:MAG: lipopolysaccharide biosynthesis protein [Sphingobium sp.]